jgi:hypothetical protein
MSPNSRLAADYLRDISNTFRDTSSVTNGVLGVQGPAEGDGNRRERPAGRIEDQPSQPTFVTHPSFHRTQNPNRNRPMPAHDHTFSSSPRCRARVPRAIPTAAIQSDQVRFTRISRAHPNAPSRPQPPDTVLGFRALCVSAPPR